MIGSDISTRYNWLDWARAMAISLVVLGHFYDLGGNVRFSSFIYGFHVPLFFLLSGITYKQKNLWNAEKTLILPFLFFQVIYIIWYTIIGLVHNEPIICVFKAQIFKFIYGLIMGGVMPAEMLWFVVVLIWDRLILNVFIRFKLLNYYTLGLFSICAFVFLIYIPFNLFFLKSVVLSFPFYFAGFFLKAKIAPPTQVCMNIHGGNRLFMYIFAIVLMGILFIGTQLNGMIYINASEYGSSLILFYLDGIIGCLGMLLICKSITISSSIVENISRSTLFLLCFHFWLVRYIRGILEHNDLIYPLYILISITVSAILILLGSFLYRITYPYLKVFYGKG